MAGLNPPRGPDRSFWVGEAHTLFAKVGCNPAIREQLQRRYRTLETAIRDELQKAYSEARSERCAEVAYALMCMSLWSDSMIQLGFPK